jgi:maleamate amidohydrolase
MIQKSGMGRGVNAWDGLIGAAELEVYRRAGYGRIRREGRRPAVLVVDMEYNFTGQKPEPILASIAKFRNSCGEAAWRSIPKIARLLRAARARRVPVVYTHGFPKKSGVTPYEARIGTDIVRQLAPRRGDAVYEKEAASAFFGTPLAGHLVGLGVDTVLVAGCTTSGCVRASVLDACSFGFRTVVVEECVFDRAPTPHRVNLFDMAQKYALVRPLARIEAWLRGLRTPRG